MALEEDLIAAAGMVLTAEEVVESDFVERGRTRVGGDVPAHGDLGPLCPVDEHGGVPPQPSAEAALDLLLAGIERLLVNGDGVDVVSGGDLGLGNGVRGRACTQRLHDLARALGSARADEPFPGLDPFIDLFVDASPRTRRGCVLCHIGVSFSRGPGSRNSTPGARRWKVLSQQVMFRSQQKPATCAHASLFSSTPSRVKVASMRP